jgi:hypothetical protein
LLFPPGSPDTAGQHQFLKIAFTSLDAKEGAMNVLLSRAYSLAVVSSILGSFCATSVAETVVITAYAGASVWNNQQTDWGTQAGHEYAAEVPGTGCSASCATIARIDQGVGAKSLTSSSLNDVQALHAEAFVRAQQVFTVTVGGTFEVPMDFSGTLGIPDAGTNFQANGGAVFSIEVRDPINGWGILDPDNAHFYFDLASVRSGGDTYQKTYGLDPSRDTFAWTGSSLTWTAKRTLAATLTPGTYAVYMDVLANSTAQAWSGGGQTFFNSYNSLKFDGASFWSVVAGTAQFHDPADPSKAHVPEPSAIVLLGLGIVGLLGLARCRQ